MSPLRALLLAQLLVYVSPAGGNHIHIFLDFLSFSFRYNLWLILPSDFSREAFFTLEVQTFPYEFLKDF